MLSRYTQLDENGNPVIVSRESAASEPEGSMEDMSVVKSIDEILAFQDWDTDTDEWIQESNTGAIWDNGYKHTNIEKSIYMTAKYLMSEILGRYPLKMVALERTNIQTVLFTNMERTSVTGSAPRKVFLIIR